MDIVRNADGTLVVPVQQERRPDPDDAASPPADGAPATRVLHPGEGGYDEALAEWDLQQLRIVSLSSRRRVGDRRR